MTRLVGVPDVAAASTLPLTATLIWTHLYQRGDRLAAGSVALTYDRDADEWLQGGLPFDLLAARFGQDDPAPPPVRILFTIGAGANAQGTSITLSPVENAAGVLDITKPLHVAAWVTGAEYESLRTQQQNAIAEMSTFASEGRAVAADIDAGLGLLADTLLHIEQSTSALANLANSIPYLNFAAFPAPPEAGKTAIALDTGNVYRSSGTSWGSPIGQVSTKALADALNARVAAVEASQGGGLIGYATKAAMNADLARPAGTLAKVTNDPTPANNGDYIKLGASGTGSWQLAAGNSDLAGRLKGWANSDSYQITSPVYHSSGALQSGTVLWPDGSAGAYAGTNYSSTYAVFLGYTVTHTQSGKTITQPAVTLDADGNITAQPALTVTP